jgi:hypothetical protein
MSGLNVRLMLAALLSPVLVLVCALLAGGLLWRRWRRAPQGIPVMSESRSA